MRGTARLAAIATSALLVTAGVAMPAVAGSEPVEVNGWTVTVTVQDYQWVNHECQHVPIAILVEGSGVDSWSVDATATLQGSGSAASSAYAFGDGSGDFTDEGFYMCPGLDRSGVYEVAGEVEVWQVDTFDLFSATFGTSFSVSAMTTVTTLDGSFRYSIAGRQMQFTGRATAMSGTLGRIG